MARPIMNWDGDAREKMLTSEERERLSQMQPTTLRFDDGKWLLALVRRLDGECAKLQRERDAVSDTLIDEWER